MMTADLPDPFRRMLAYFEAFRRLGFAPGQIFVVTTPDSNDVGVQLDVDGKQFNVNCGPIDLPRERVRAEWIAVAAHVADGSYADGDLDNNFRAVFSDPSKATTLVCALVEFGISLPAAEDKPVPTVAKA